jgi:hypothetical protein
MSGGSAAVGSPPAEFEKLIEATGRAIEMHSGEIARLRRSISLVEDAGRVRSSTSAAGELDGLRSKLAQAERRLEKARAVKDSAEAARRTEQMKPAAQAEGAAENRPGRPLSRAIVSGTVGLFCVLGVWGLCRGRFDVPLRLALLAAPLAIGLWQGGPGRALGRRYALCAATFAMMTVTTAVRRGPLSGTQVLTDTVLTEAATVFCVGAACVFFLSSKPRADRSPGSRS